MMESDYTQEKRFHFAVELKEIKASDPVSRGPQLPPSSHYPHVSPQPKDEDDNHGNCRANRQVVIKLLHANAGKGRGEYMVGIERGEEEARAGKSRFDQSPPSFPLPIRLSFHSPRRRLPGIAARRKPPR